MNLVRCNVCGWIGEDKKLLIKNDMEFCPECKHRHALMDIDKDCLFDKEDSKKLKNFLKALPCNDGKIEEDFLAFPEGTDKKEIISFLETF